MIQIDQMLIVYLQLLTAWQSKFVVWAIRGMLSPTDRWYGLPPIPHAGDHPCCWGLGSWFLDNLHKLESHATLSITFHPRMKFCNNLCENKIQFESKYLTVNSRSRSRSRSISHLSQKVSDIKDKSQKGPELTLKSNCTTTTTN